MNTIEKLIILPGTAVAWDLFLLQRKLVIVSNFFTSSYMPFCINEDLFLSFNGYNLGVAVRLKSIYNLKYEGKEITNYLILL